MKINREMVESIGNGVILLGRSATHLPTLPRQYKRVLEQCLQIGYKTAPLVFILCFCIGGVLALQVGDGFRNYGFKQYIGSIVGLAMVRELGPVMAAIIVAGRVGSAITAELASMRVYQEVDALRTMNIAPERVLVLPRLVAILLTMPFLTIMSVLAGWLGGALVAQYEPSIQLDYSTFFQVMKNFVKVEALTDGLIKGQVFGFCVVLICCNVGLLTKGGPREIGHAVTRAVVASIICILFLDYFVTKAIL
ncbi:MAG: ABC transporter permease [Verrucomicrobiota bacterium]|nr:ABC transporter permease [Verrucomicrobiota bacterium]